MTDHPIQPTPEQVQELVKDNGYAITPERLIAVIKKSYAAGADAELKACCEWLEQQTFCGHRNLIPALYASRRPKPLSSKQQARRALSSIMSSQKGIFDYRPFKILENIIAELPND